MINFKIKNKLYHGYRLSKIITFAYIAVILIYIKCIIGGIYVIKKQNKEDKN
jgi:hypothetical protein